VKQRLCELISVAVLGAVLIAGCVLEWRVAVERGAVSDPPSPIEARDGH